MYTDHLLQRQHPALLFFGKSSFGCRSPRSFPFPRLHKSHRTILSPSDVFCSAVFYSFILFYSSLFLFRLRSLLCCLWLFLQPFSMVFLNLSLVLSPGMASPSAHPPARLYLMLCRAPSCPCAPASWTFLRSPFFHPVCSPCCSLFCPASSLLCVLLYISALLHVVFVLLFCVLIILFFVLLLLPSHRFLLFHQDTGVFPSPHGNVTASGLCRPCWGSPSRDRPANWAVPWHGPRTAAAYAAMVSLTPS